MHTCGLACIFILPNTGQFSVWCILLRVIKHCNAPHMWNKKLNTNVKLSYLLGFSLLRHYITINKLTVMSVLYMVDKGYIKKDAGIFAQILGFLI